jgi:2-methylfumaryl-CoA hydratase
MSEPVHRIVEGPSFEDLEPGVEFDAPGITLTTAHAVWYQALSGDRMRLPLDHAAAARVTGAPAPLAHPLLAINIAIGQSTWASQRVKANLGYRGVQLKRPAFIGDTLYTRTRVVGARRNQSKAGRAPTGVVALEMRTVNQEGAEVMTAWRFPMIPCRTQAAAPAAADADILELGVNPAREEILASVPPWDIRGFPRSLPPSPRPQAGEHVRVAARDTVTGAPELVRLTTNMAMAHLDGTASHTGERLVYGGHTIAIAFAQVTRALPDLVTVLAWERCDHIGPVFEQDRLSTAFDVLEALPLERGMLLKLHVRTGAERAEPKEPEPVLDWVLYALTV